MGTFQKDIRRQVEFPPVHFLDQNSATVTLRVLAQVRTAEALSPLRFLRLVTDNIMRGYPGVTFHLDTRQGYPKPVFEYYVSLLPQADVKHQVHLPWTDGDAVYICPLH
jgi:hypothetical protein